MSAEERLIDSLAQRIYTTTKTWQADLDEDSSTWPRWFALHEDYKLLYREAAKTLIEATQL